VGGKGNGEREKKKWKKVYPSSTDTALLQERERKKTGGGKKIGKGFKAPKPAHWLSESPPSSAKKRRGKRKRGAYLSMNGDIDSVVRPTSLKRNNQKSKKRKKKKNPERSPARFSAQRKREKGEGQGKRGKGEEKSER